ncbi:protein kinase-like protein [Cryobacterium psychrophilum]|nr:protein kinase-like protein [Cryobacterium psychrophilum]
MIPARAVTRTPLVQAPPVPESVRNTSDLAGYRVVRRLASGEHSDVYLGYSATPGMAPVALKVFRPEADTESIEREIRVLCSAPDNRLVRLIDVASLPDERVCLVQERLEGRTLGRILLDRGTISAGEAVTLLAPVIVAVAGLHESGLGHDAIGPAAILLHPSGRPLLAGLSSLRELPDAPTMRLRALREDYSRVVSLLRDVFAHLDAAAASNGATREAALLVDRFESLISRTPFRPCLPELERQLFEWAPAAPVLLGAPEFGGTQTVPITLRRDPEAIGEYPVTQRTGRHRENASARPRATKRRDHVTHRGAPSSDRPGEVTVPPGRGTSLGFPADALALGQTLSGSAWQLLESHPGERLRARVGSAVRLRRRPVLVAVLVGASAVVLALSLLPPGGEPSRGQEPLSAGLSDSQSDSQSNGQTAAASSSPSLASDTPAAPGSPAPRAGPESENPVALTGDDPVLAVSGLLDARAECLAQASIICLDAVDQSGSTALAADSYAVRMRQEGGAAVREPDYTSLAASLVERTGNVALVALTASGSDPTGGDSTGALNSKPASVLVVKGEAGWRLREILTY